MAQYGGDQQYRQEVHQTDEYGNPIQKTEEHETIVQSDTGGQYQRQVRHTDEHGTTVQKTDQFGNPVHSTTGRTTGDYGSTGRHQGLGQGNLGTGTDTTSHHQEKGTGIDHAPGGTGMEYTPGGRSIGQTGYQGMGTEPGSHGGTMGDYGSTRQQHQGLGQGNQGARTDTFGTGTGAGTDYTSGGRSVGQTGYQGLGTEPGHQQGLGQGKQGLGAEGRGTGQGLGREHGHGDTTDHEKKGMMEKIKEKLPGRHD